MKNLIQPYNPTWKIEFEHIQQTLKNELIEFDIDIQHVGSTAIPTLCAKPILDIDIILKNSTQIDNISEKLSQLGYINRGEQGIAGRFAFRQSSSFTPLSSNAKQWQEHHLYVCFADSLALKNHILFRDTLLQSKKLTAEYAQLKKNLVEQKGITREQYTQQKTAFILQVLSTNGLNEEELNQIKDENK